MTTTAITIVYDAVNNTHLTLTFEVDDQSGAYQCTHSHIGDNRETMEQMWESAALLVGIPNVQVVEGKLWEPGIPLVLKVAGILEARKARQQARQQACNIAPCYGESDCCERPTLMPTGEEV